jgi:hypothetical protein
LGISSLSEKITEYRDKWKAHCKEWNIPAFHYRHINNNRPENETWVDQEEDGERQQY